MAPSEASLIGGISMSSCLPHDASVKSKVLWLTRSPNSRLEGDETQLQQRRKAEKAASGGDIHRHISRRRGWPDGATRMWASTTDFEADDHNERRESLHGHIESERPFSDRKRQRAVQLVLAILALIGVMVLISITVAWISRGPSLFLEAFAKSGFAAAFALIFVSEIGDKTFFIAALLAMRHSKSLVNHLSSPIGILGETFSLVFLAEWGDRSMLATIALGAAQAPLGVATGAIVGHMLATGLAVVGGAFLAQYISEKLVGYIGGFLFLAFAAATVLGVF